MRTRFGGAAVRLGNGPLTSQVDLCPNQTVDVVLDLLPPTVLAKVDVVVDREVNLRPGVDYLYE